MTESEFFDGILEKLVDAVPVEPGERGCFSNILARRLGAADLCAMPGGLHGWLRVMRAAADGDAAARLQVAMLLDR